jgi:SAM-dependent methyltransferase
MVDGMVCRSTRSHRNPYASIRRVGASAAAPLGAPWLRDATRIFRCPHCSGRLIAEQGVRCAACARSYSERNGVLELLTSPLGGPAYDPHYFETLPLVEDTHFWYIVRCELVLETLQRFVPDLSQRALFDVGCGSGGLLAWLQRHGVVISGACDSYPQALQLVRRKLDIPLALVDEGRHAPLAPGHSMIGIFDVLEHLDDDEGALANLFQSLAPGGVLVLTVPAHPFLFDQADVIAGHRRRYRRAELGAKLARAGFRVATVTHFMAPLACLLAPVRFLVRLMTRRLSPLARRDLELRPVPVVNDLVLAVLRLERALLRRVTLPFGTSLIALGVRPAD